MREAGPDRGAAPGQKRSLAPLIVLSSKRSFARLVALSNGITRADLRRTADGFKRAGRRIAFFGNNAVLSKGVIHVNSGSTAD